MPVVAEILQDAHRLGEFHAVLGAIPRRQRLEDVGDAHHPRLHGHVVTLKALRVALAVHAFVMAAGILRHVLEVFRPWRASSILIVATM